MNLLYCNAIKKIPIYISRIINMRYLFIINSSGKYQLYDTQNHQWENTIYDNVTEPQKKRGLSIIRIFSCKTVQEGDKKGIYSILKKRLIIPCEYDDILYDYHERFNDGWVVSQKGKWGLLSIKGDVILPCVYDEIVPESYAWSVKQNRLWGIYDNRTKTIEVPCMYDEIIVSSNDYQIRKGNEWVTINR